ncbi:MAG: hypothetical protein DMF06_06560 [Verrucomicrobia bacterium]|nr:MAG: hypothetical protein DMF06_06560 [Verrucomicrobiota bacterium]
MPLAAVGIRYAGGLDRFCEQVEINARSMQQSAPATRPLKAVKFQRSRFPQSRAGEWTSLSTCRPHNFDTKL